MTTVITVFVVDNYSLNCKQGLIFRTLCVCVCVCLTETGVCGKLHHQ